MRIYQVKKRKFFDRMILGRYHNGLEGPKAQDTGMK